MNAENAEPDVEIESLELSGPADARGRRGGIVALITLFAALALVAGLVISRSPDAPASSAVAPESAAESSRDADVGGSASASEPGGATDTTDAMADNAMAEPATDMAADATSEPTTTPTVQQNEDPARLDNLLGAEFEEAVEEAQRTAALAKEAAAEAERLKLAAPSTSSDTSNADSSTAEQEAALAAEQAAQEAARAAAQAAAAQAAVAAAQQAIETANAANAAADELNAIEAAEAAADAAKLEEQAAAIARAEAEAAKAEAARRAAEAATEQGQTNGGPSSDSEPTPVPGGVPGDVGPDGGVVNCVQSPCCYISPGAADEPAWWCDEQLCDPTAPHPGCPVDPPPPIVCVTALDSTGSAPSASSSLPAPEQCEPDPYPLPVPTSVPPVCLQAPDGAVHCPPSCTEQTCPIVPPPATPCPAIYPPPPDCFPACLGSPAGPNELGGCPTPEPLPLPICDPLDGCFPPCSIENVDGCLVEPVPEPLPEPKPLPEPCARLDQPLTVCITPVPEPQPLPICDGTQIAPTPGDCIKPPPTATSVPQPPPTEVPLPAPAPEVGFNAGDYVGLSVGAAESVAAANGFTSRIGRIDGEWFALTMDFRTDRVTFEIDNGIVTSVQLG